MGETRSGVFARRTLSVLCRFLRESNLLAPAPVQSDTAGLGWRPRAQSGLLDGGGWQEAAGVSVKVLVLCQNKVLQRFVEQNLNNKVVDWVRQASRSRTSSAPRWKSDVGLWCRSPTCCSSWTCSRCSHMEIWTLFLRAPLATPLGRYAGRTISSQVKQILSWNTTGMQRTMVNIPGVDKGILHLANNGSCRLSENRSQRQSERTRSIRWCAGLGHLQLLAHCGTTEEEGWAHRGCSHEKVGGMQLFVGTERCLIVDHECHWQGSCPIFQEVKFISYACDPQQENVKGTEHLAQNCKVRARTFGRTLQHEVSLRWHQVLHRQSYLQIVCCSMPNNVFNYTRNRHHELYTSLRRTCKPDCNSCYPQRLICAVCFLSVSGRHVSFFLVKVFVVRLSLTVVVAFCIMAAKAERLFVFLSESVIEGHLFEDRAVVTFAREVRHHTQSGVKEQFWQHVSTCPCKLWLLCWAGNRIFNTSFDQWKNQLSRGCPRWQLSRPRHPKVKNTNVPTCFP